MSVADLDISTLGQLLAAHAQERPGAEAFLGHGGSGLSYGELQALVTRRSHRLRELGLGRNDRVALLAGNDAGAAGAFFSVASVAACAPLRPPQSESELAGALRQLQAKALIAEVGATPAVRRAAANLGLPVLELKSSASGFDFAGDPVGPPRHDVAPEPGDVALLLHTTGSTRHPKLVPFTQAGLLHAARGTARALELDDSDRCLNFMPLFHVHGLVSGLLVPLVAGGSTACVGPFDVESFFGWLVDLRPTWYSTAPPIHQMILREVRRRGVPTTSLRFVRSGSAVLPPATAKGLEEGLGVPVIEAYGMTEVPNISGNPRGAPRLGSVGRSAGPEIAILDPGGASLPPGEVGEIAVRGPSVTTGYIDDPSATATAFVDGWLRTGDLGLLDADGYLFLRGRYKELINRGGDKVAPAEVDTALLAHPAVEQGLAFAVPHPVLGEDLAAAVVLRAPGAASESDLLRLLRRNLSPHKVPTRVLLVDELPMGATGKPDRGLAAASFHRLDASSLEASAGELPASPAERFVATIWRAVLDLPEIGRDDDFFLLGGTSLDAVAVASRLEKALAEAVHVPLVMTSRTVRLLAGRLESSYGTALARLLGAGPQATTPPLPIDGEARERLRALVRRRFAGSSPLPVGASNERRNPPAVFLLSAPRSGSTLLRAMLAGHPRLFAPPELRLLHFASLADWYSAHDGPSAFFREGLARAVMQLFAVSFEEAVDLIARRVAEEAGVQALIGELQAMLGERRLVDKTPLYAVDPTALERLETWFEEPLYIHLVRHPGAVVHSYTRRRMDQLWFGEQPFAPRQLGELLWLESQENALEHLRGVPRSRWHRVELESLVTQPERVLRQLCDFLGLAFDSRLLTPYDNAPQRMIDPVRPGSRAIGDPYFTSHDDIDASCADAWRSELDPSTLAPGTRQMARQLGYGTEPPESTGLEPLFAVVRTWRGNRVRPGGLLVGRNVEPHEAVAPRRPLFWCLQSEHELDGLAARLGPERPVYAMRSAHHVLDKTPTELRALASLYAREIQAVDPDGPYLLGGNCQGGRIAFDVARQLQGLGARVELLVLMETFIESPYPGRVALLYGAASHRNPYSWRADPEVAWRRSYGDYSVDIIPGRHGEFFNPPNIEPFIATLRRRLDRAETP